MTNADQAPKDNIKRMDITEFREHGFLQEVNRKFFHPLGLALETVTGEDGVERLGGIWDYRDDPEGILFGDGMLDRDKAARVSAERDRHRDRRAAIFDACVVIQPLPQPPEQEVEDAAACRHCGRLSEADGDHSCTCPHPDETCPDHTK